MIKFKILPGGLPVYRKHEGDAGIDLRSPIDFSLWPGETQLIDLRVATKIPDGWVGLLTTRSSVAAKADCRASMGVIDSGYTGPLFFNFKNMSEEIQSFAKGDRIAQLVVVPFYTGGFEYVMDLEDTDRGEGGIGSTGRN